MATESKKAELNALLFEIADVIENRKFLEAREAALRSAIEIKMSECGVRNVENSKAKAQYSDRKTTTVDPVRYSDLVTTDEWLSSISINVPQARKFLRDVDFKQCSTTTVSSSLVITQKKAKV